MNEKGGVYPSAILLNQYTNILTVVSDYLTVDAYNGVLEIMVKIYYMRDSGRCLFANILMDVIYHALKKNNNTCVNDLRIYK